jgi:mRNA interferase RelE/StbE
VPRYTVVAHKRVLRFLRELEEGTLKDRIKQAVKKLADYPLSLRELDVEKLEGLERAFRVRIGRYRMIFHVDKKERVVFVTHLGKRESIYES